ncbi:MAG: alpha/beta fold hydrolase [Streptosporangiales bacterium]|nr:alpha/beta fold hydrolase [Streptosporangiales bacterium]
MRAPDESLVWIDGPWTHRTVSAGGTRFHVAEAGDGPLAVLLHGFPEFWWSWHHQLTALSAAGYRAVAADLRGYGGSDKPPRGYDLVTLASDVAGLVRALGEAGGIIVGHDWGGLLGWTMGVYHPKVVHRLVTVSIPHPLRMRAAALADPRGQAWASRYTLGFQLPIMPERQLLRDDAALVSRILRAWSGDPDWPDDRTERLCRDAMRIPGVAHCALEYYRWVIRSLPRPDGIRYAREMRVPIRVPTLQLHGALDKCVLPRSAQGSGRYVEAPYRWRLLAGAGHFPHEEMPQQFNTELLGWLADPEPDR